MKFTVANNSVRMEPDTPFELDWLNLLYQYRGTPTVRHETKQVVTPEETRTYPVAVVIEWPEKVDAERADLVARIAELTDKLEMGALQDLAGGPEPQTAGDRIREAAKVT